MGNICIFSKEESVEKMKKTGIQAFLLKRLMGVREHRPEYLCTVRRSM